MVGEMEWLYSRGVLIEKMQSSDGVVFASPNYSFHVSAIMKIFLDRLTPIYSKPLFYLILFLVILSISASGFLPIVKHEA